MNHLMVFILDRLSDLVTKGEVLQNYYNPEDTYQKVTIVVCNWRKDYVNPKAVQPMVGTAKLEIIQYPLPSPITTFGWRFVERWLQRGVEQLAPLNPDMVWALGSFQFAQLAARVSKVLNTPMVMCLHGRWDVDEQNTIPRWVYAKLHVHAEEESIQAADVVIPVYEDIVPYAKKRGAKRIEVIYNAINAQALRQKESYHLLSPMRLLILNRQVEQKDPSNILRALAESGLSYTLDIIGNGPMHEELNRLTAELGTRGRTCFIRTMLNKTICERMPTYDMFLGTCHYPAITKGTLEAGYAGLPIVLNQRRGEPITELSNDWMMIVEDSVDGYGEAIKILADNWSMRQRLGKAARRQVMDKFQPQNSAARRAIIFRQLARKTAG